MSPNVDSRTTRRSFLYGSAAVAGTVALTACSSSSSGSKDPGTSGASKSGSAAPTGASKAPTGTGSRGSSVKPLAKPAKYAESPALAALVKSGKLPAVDKRLPDNPYVIPHLWVKPGKYGGMLNMAAFASSGTAKADSNRELCYGHSLLRYLNDGLDIGPGLVEKWSSNRDTSVWTFKFRTGLKWSDGQPWTTEDILFWWEDIVLPGYDAQTPPDECKSGKGTVAKLAAPDATTLTMTFDAPAPLAGDRLAMWTNGSIGKNGASWMHPKHYLKQFHPKYNKKVPKNWDTVGGLWEQHADWMQNPACPTMNGFRTKSYNNGTGLVLERNPYYYAVMPNGDQLPYFDGVNMPSVQDAQVGKLMAQQGKVDFVLGKFLQLDLSDVATLKASEEKSQIEIVLWDGGSGSGSVFFLNFDYPDDELRKLFRDPRFRQAISHAYNRTDANKALYFNQAEPTTGTMSPKAKEYVADDAGKAAYKQWRDSYITYDKDKANALLDALGMKKGADGVRTLPSGKKFTLSMDYSADISTTEANKDEQLVANLKDVGIHARRNPVSPDAYGDEWTAGKLMVHTNWEVGDGPNHLVYPQWFVPIESSRWAPLEGAYYNAIGTPKATQQQNVSPWKRNPPRLEPDKGGPIDRMWKLYNQTKIEPDAAKRTELVFEILKIHVEEGPFFMGTAANYPQVVPVKKGLMNVPRKENLAQGGFANPWVHPTPAVYDPECFFWDDPSKHSA
jgi:peptide/nickel transport system substrate-binding protein